MRRLKKEGKLSEAEMTFFHDSKPPEELYDLRSDPDELNNLAADPNYADELAALRSLEQQWVATHRDYGLDDLGKRQPEKGLAAETARAGVKRHQPQWWQRLESGELMKTQQWMKDFK